MTAWRQSKIALIGLDSSHSVEFARRMQAPECSENDKVEGMRAVTCLRFETPFQDQQGLDERQAQLESWGIRVTESFDEAVADCDALFIEVNDPGYHLEYFTRSAELGKPLLLDKPLADTIDNGRKIASIAAEKNVRFFCASSLRFVPALTDACQIVPDRSAPFIVDMSRAYTDLLAEIGKFLNGAEAPAEMADTLEIMSMLDAAERSLESGAVETV